MSVSTQSTERYECSRDNCHERFTTSNAVDGSFCSRLCRDIDTNRKTARDILNQIERDHRFCATCFARHKEVDKPPQNHSVNIGPVRHPGRARMLAKNCLIGFQYTTHWADEGDRTRTVDKYGRERLVGHGPTCACGNTHHRQDEASLSTRFAFEYGHKQLVDAVAELRSEGKTDAQVDRDALDAALVDELLPVETAPETVNWEIVLAAALES